MKCIIRAIDITDFNKIPNDIIKDEALLSSSSFSTTWLVRVNSEVSV